MIISRVSSRSSEADAAALDVVVVVADCGILLDATIDET